ncbi:hypothetical protein ACOMICROBIO_FLGHMIGD_02157 [Vibrio sp. B1FLJ16]|uniref:DUF5363 family protein n=1 Tax=Vibrio sp. B1FLJ16 TaxID=2751178 RepID=UPI0015F528D2|nr:DUF5363 family protein [Vibrio sp. B1FLJ16]CAD7810352.1 hypothetical protein ACOMICROBIO_FLGHMIGD_02157 [Vibrio sp. B1FLJ16]CAE6912088.1 hypothetical protein ACOMICROBIO_FLGHMIGD_02157 [Vibrio sp. B1FLJ16]
MNWIKRGIKRYDDWCDEMGLTPDQKRSCVPYRKDPVHKGEEKITSSQPGDSHEQSQDEAL